MRRSNKPSSFYRIHATDDIDIDGLEMSAVFSRKIKTGEKLEVEIHKSDGTKVISLLVVKEEKGHLYVTSVKENICICEVLTAPKLPLGCILLRKKKRLVLS